MFDCSIKDQYVSISKHRSNDFDTLEKIIKDYYPDYLSYFYAIVNGKNASYCNSYIMRKSVIKKYFEWLFPLLDIFDKTLDITEYDQQEKRAVGYVAEILINVWIKHNKIKVKYEYMVENDESSFIKYIMNIVNINTLRIKNI